MADLLTSAPVISAGSDAVKALLKGWYRRCNPEVHADPGAAPQIPLLDGRAALDLEIAPADLEKVMRRAALLRIQRAIATRDASARRRVRHVTTPGRSSSCARSRHLAE